ncbi:MAG: Transporter, LysE family [Ktedonobacterales bacterium]|jgi:threonine/homoserine/homoserine lactone efflux protein|nr:MAG: Transporter, LysE family [Ktedonobacterales bacterium]
MDVFLRGLLLGLAIAAPVGPIGVLCIRRTLVMGRAVGLVSGMGAATADMFYGGVAAFGLTAVSDILTGQRLWLHLIGGAFLCYLGLRTALSQPAERAAETSGSSLAGAYSSTLFLTLTNPLTILSFVVIFAGLGIVNNHVGGYGPAAAVTAGVFFGSTLWWFILSGGVNLLRGRFTLRALRWVNVASGMLLLGFGIYTLFTI